jgi:long-subunit acyl-CoA synthetase (AMP-forming)
MCLSWCALLSAPSRLAWTRVCVCYQAMHQVAPFAASPVPAALYKRSFAMQELCEDKDAADYTQKRLETEGREAGLKGFEIVKKVHLTPSEFTVENDLITPSFKLKRPQLKKEFRDQIKEMYKALGP